MAVPFAGPINRVYGRTIPDEFGNRHWIEVSTADNGSNDYVMVTALIQCIKLQTGESPFFADFGVPARQSIMTQVAPDLQAARIQQRYAAFFANLLVVRVHNPPANLKVEPVPTYLVRVLTHQGTKIAQYVAV